jgi:hypothetical protein
MTRPTSRRPQPRFYDMWHDQGNPA